METRQLTLRLTWTDGHGWDLGGVEIRLTGEHEERQEIGECVGVDSPRSLATHLLDEFIARVNVHRWQVEG